MRLIASFLIFIVTLTTLSWGLRVNNAFKLRRLQKLHASEGDVSPPAPSGLKAKLSVDMKEAMRAKEKVKLAAIRSIQTAIKQTEVDQRLELTDEMIVALMSKLVKQRKESIKSFVDGGRPELATSEQEECDFIISYMPKQMTEDEIAKFVDEVVTKVGATTVKDMGKVMAEVRPALAGKADMALVGDMIKKKLGGK